jgi:hypothetical protein
MDHSMLKTMFLDASGAQLRRLLIRLTALLLVTFAVSGQLSGVYEAARSLIPYVQLEQRIWHRLGSTILTSPMVTVENTGTRKANNVVLRLQLSTLLRASDFKIDAVEQHTVSFNAVTRELRVKFDRLAPGAEVRITGTYSSAPGKTWSAASAVSDEGTATSAVPLEEALKRFGARVAEGTNSIWDRIKVRFRFDDIARQVTTGPKEASLPTQLHPEQSKSAAEITERRVPSYFEAADGQNGRSEFLSDRGPRNERFQYFWYNVPDDPKSNSMLLATATIVALAFMMGMGALTRLILFSAGMLLFLNPSWLFGSASVLTIFFAVFVILLLAGNEELGRSQKAGSANASRQDLEMVSVRMGYIFISGVMLSVITQSIGPTLILAGLAIFHVVLSSELRWARQVCQNAERTPLVYGCAVALLGLLSFALNQPDHLIAGDRLALAVAIFYFAFKLIRSHKQRQVEISEHLVAETERQNELRNAMKLARLSRANLITRPARTPSIRPSHWRF